MPRQQANMRDRKSSEVLVHTCVNDGCVTGPANPYAGTKPCLHK